MSDAKIVPLPIWNKLMLWCEMMAKEHRRDLETLNCDDLLNEILADIQEEERKDDSKKES